MKVIPTIFLLLLSYMGSAQPQAGGTVATRFSVPAGYYRANASLSSFSAYLRNLPLKPQGSAVLLYNGEEKPASWVHAAVVALPIGKQNLHQCADAVMRLRADYLYAQKKYAEIGFHFTNGFYAPYSEWMKGKRIAIKGNKTWWEQKGPASNTPTSYWKYLETIFMYAGTLSLSKELKPVPIAQIQIGDVFIQGGSPGHAVIVIDMAIHQTTGEKIIMLAQSYMPAQELHVLANPNSPTLSPWYNIPPQGQLETPEWTFELNQLMRF